MDSIPLVSASGLTSKQQKLLEELGSCVSATGIKLYVNCFAPEWREGPFSVDVEHDEQGNLVGIGLSDGVSCEYFTSADVVKHKLENGQLVAHNGVSDVECLNTWGINVRDSQLVWDTMLLGHIIDSSQRDYSLKGFAERELGIVYPSYDSIVGKRGLKAERVTLDKQPIQLVALYNAMDTYCTYKLYELQKKATGL